jgi:HlyD family secretion protein
MITRPDPHPKTTYREGLMELKAPQAGTVKDLSTTTTEGAVVQPGSVILTLVPLGEPLFADVAIKNEDIGFIQVGQSAQAKLAAYPFQKYGLLTGKVVHVSADATEINGQGGGNGNAGGGSPSSAANPASQVATYKARVALDQQHLISGRKKTASRCRHASRRRNPPGPPHRAGVPAVTGDQGGARGG